MQRFLLATSTDGGALKVAHRVKKLRDIARGVRLYRKFREMEFGSGEALQAYQDARLRAVVSHARRHSPYYGRLCASAGVPLDFQLGDLPVTDKRMMMDHFDQWVTDRRLSLAKIERQIETDPEEEYYLGEYRIVATSGSSGLRGIFVYDRREWSVVIAASLRWANMYGTSIAELIYKRLASVKADKPTHATSRLGQSLDLGMRKLLMLDATAPIEELVGQLNDFKPELLMGYASLISLLAVEQTDGRLAIAPEMVASFSEVLGPDRVRRVEQAWNITPFNHYGAAEQVMIAADCDAHEGLHHFADMSIIEVVDEENRPVPPGTPGHKVLLTNLHKFVQPIIRYEMSDMLTLSPRPCSCGRSFPLLEGIGGRSEDVVQLTGRDGQPVSLSPMVMFDCLIELAEIAEYQHRLEGNRILLRVVPRRGADRAALRQRAKEAVTAALEKLGAAGFEVEVDTVDHIARSAEGMGKLKVIGGN